MLPGQEDLRKALGEGRRSALQLFTPPIEENAIGLNVPANWAWAAISDPAHRIQWDFGMRGERPTPEGGPPILERHLPLAGVFFEQVRLSQPPADDQPGRFESSLLRPRGMLTRCETRFTVRSEGRFSRVDALIAADISPFFFRRWLGGVLAAWLARSLARLKEYVEALAKGTL